MKENQEYILSLRSSKEIISEVGSGQRVKYYFIERVRWLRMGPSFSKVKVTDDLAEQVQGSGVGLGV